MQYRGRYEGGSYRPVTSPTVLGPPRFAGLPVVSWAFAFRIWIAVVVALCAAFWLQLEAASSAATSVAILAAPTRGQVLQKASFRLLADQGPAAACLRYLGRPLRLCGSAGGRQPRLCRGALRLLRSAHGDRPDRRAEYRFRSLDGARRRDHRWHRGHRRRE